MVYPLACLWLTCLGWLSGSSVGQEVIHFDDPASPLIGQPVWQGREPVFKFRRYSIDPGLYFDQPRIEPGIIRTWYFEHCSRTTESWQQTEINEQQLTEYFYRPAWQFTGNLLSDTEFFYSRESMSQLGAVLLVAAVFANTSIDENFRSWLMEQKATEPDVDCWFREFGNGSYLLGATAAAWTISHCARKRWGATAPAAVAMGDWSDQVFRSYIVGGPSLLAIQYLTGASRPLESPDGSKWNPFNDNNGASGHTFVGALPFLVAAKMAKRPLAKAALVAGSGLAGYGRLCDDGHYLSQVMLGWTVAYLAVEATTATNQASTKYRLVPLDLRGAYGLGIEIRR